MSPLYHDSDTLWTPVTFQNSWVNFDVANHTPAAYRKVNDLVYVRGLIKSGAIGTAAFTLPIGYRPPLWLHLHAASNNLFGAFEIQSTGVVIPTVGSNVWFSLDGTVFGTT